MVCFQRTYAGELSDLFNSQAIDVEESTGREPDILVKLINIIQVKGESCFGKPVAMTTAYEALIAVNATNYPARSKRSKFITLFQAAIKSATNFFCPSSQA